MLPEEMDALPYLAGYPEPLLARARSLLASGELEALLRARYPDKHAVRSGKALTEYVQRIKAERMRTAPPLGRAVFDDKLTAVHEALGLQVTSMHVQGSKLRKRREIRIASLFKDAPRDFLRMIVVHELAHLRHAEHTRDFYRLCEHMEPEYHALELDLRLYLTAREHSGGV